VSDMSREDLERALRAAEGQVAHLNAKLDATHTNRCFNCEQTVTEATTARQAAAVAQMREDAALVADREAEDATATLATFEFGTIGHARHGARMTTAESIAKAIRALPAPAEVVAVSTFSPAPAVSPVAAPKPGPKTHAQSECLRCGNRTPGMHDCKPPFDAEAALVAMREALRHHAYSESASVADLHLMLDKALAAGRGSGR